jgi:hypothetical protein
VESQHRDKRSWQGLLPGKHDGGTAKDPIKCARGPKKKNFISENKKILFLFLHLAGM